MAFDREPGGPIFLYPFSATAIGSAATNGYDVYCIQAPSNARLALRELRLGQFTEFGDGQSELLSLTILTGSTALSSGGSLITGINVKRYTGAATAASSATVTGPSTTLASTAGAALAFADSWNVAAGFVYRPPQEERIELGRSQIMCVRMGVVNDGLTLNGTLTLQQLAQTPQ